MAPSRVSKKCPLCIVEDQRCVFGTSTGYCGRCHKHSEALTKNRTRAVADLNNDRLYDSFFNKGKDFHWLLIMTSTKTATDLRQLLLQMKPKLPPGDLAYHNVIVVVSKSKKTEIFELKAENFKGSNYAAYRLEMENFVRRFCRSGIVANKTTNALVLDAILACEFFEFIFVKKDEQPSVLDDLSLDLSLQIMEFAFCIIDDTFGAVFKALSGIDKSEEAIRDILAATGVLQIQARVILSGLEKGILEPICGPAKDLIGIVKHQLSATVQNMDNVLCENKPPLCCSPQWRDHLSGDLDNAFANVRASETRYSVKREVAGRDSSTPEASSASPMTPPESSGVLDFMEGLETMSWTNENILPMQDTRLVQDMYAQPSGCTVPDWGGLGFEVSLPGASTANLASAQRMFETLNAQFDPALNWSSPNNQLPPSQDFAGFPTMIGRPTQDKYWMQSDNPSIGSRQMNTGLSGNGVNYPMTNFHHNNYNSNSNNWARYPTQQSYQHNIMLPNRREEMGYMQHVSGHSLDQYISNDASDPSVMHTFVSQGGKGAGKWRGQWG